MGIIRSKAQNHIDISSESGQYFSSVTGSTCGWQPYMEDYNFVHSCHGVTFIVILDGHRGPEVAQICKDILPLMLENSSQIKIGKTKYGIQKVLQELDEEIIKNTEKLQQIQKKHNIPLIMGNNINTVKTKAGTCLVMVGITEEEVIIGNIGSCKAYVCYKHDMSKAVLISGNHTINNEEDYQRVKKAQGFFINDKLNGMIGFTRSIGDFQFKQNRTKSKNQQLLISSPSIFSLRRQDLGTVVMGSGGVWQRPAHLLNQLSKPGDSKQKIQLLLDQLIAQSPSSTNGLQNMSIVYIQIN